MTRVDLSRIDAVLLDMDGTLIDTEPLWFKAEQAVAARHGAELPDHAFEELLGLDVDGLVEALVSRYGLAASRETFLSELGQEVAGRLAHAEARPGAEALVTKVASRWERRAVVSNSPSIVVDATLEPHPWSRLLARRYSADLVDKGKPEPDLYLLAAQRLAVDPARCLVVEDSPTGVTAARRAGMTCIAVTFGESHGADFSMLTEYVVDSLDAARKLVNGS